MEEGFSLEGEAYMAVECSAYPDPMKITLDSRFFG
jgi:hypothetical protein